MCCNILGRETEYVRRKVSAQCFNGEEMERKTFVKNCECTEMDWECDFTHARAVGSQSGGPGLCKKVFDVNMEQVIHYPDFIASSNLKLFKTSVNEKSICEYLQFKQKQCLTDHSYYQPNGYIKVQYNTIVVQDKYRFC